MRALIVEDDMASRIILAKILSEQFECDSAENGLQGVEMFKNALQDQEPYDLIFMDIMMPVMDGQSALQAIRELEDKNKVPIGKEVKAVMTTALSDTKNVTEAFFSGQADAYISKPVSREKILNALKEVRLVE
ncbi:response regulator [Desulfonatronovibrio hydrogenovorans]|uniref:response regulator n=1 Tax=Desulfonatronovibrio hydrogenovorans TaxID=53245 RepID=UPI00048A9C2E|nr:response regulator [Desulfonatronovibrio hydrogenovorans]